MSPLPRGNRYLGPELQTLPVRVPGDCTIPSSSLIFFSGHMNTVSFNRFAGSAGITSGETSIISAQRAGGTTQTRLASSSLSTKKSVYSYLIYRLGRAQLLLPYPQSTTFVSTEKAARTGTKRPRRTRPSSSSQCEGSTTQRGIRRGYWPTLRQGRSMPFHTTFGTYLNLTLTLLYS